MSRELRLGTAALAASAMFAALGAPAAHASVGVVGWFGNETGSGSKGGEFNSPRDIAVNSSGAGPANAGDIYVANERNNRVDRFDSDGNFISAWGANVVTPSVTEVQLITVDATGGTFKLKFEGEETAAISESATAGQVQTAVLTGIAKLGGEEFPRSILVAGPTGGPWTVTFKNQEGASFAGTNVEQMQGDGSALIGGAATIEVTTTTQGSGAYQICTVKAACLAGTETGAANEGDNAKNGSLGHPQSIAVDEDTGNVYVSDRDGRRINEYDGQGNFIRSFGWGVDASVPGEEYEVCEGADRCRQGANKGSGVGQIGKYTGSEVLGIAVSQPNGEAEVGTVFLADSINSRVNTYKLDGTEPSSFGSTTNFGSVQPRKLAVDSNGIVYASNSNQNAEIERYDTETAEFLEPILASGAGVSEQQRVHFTGFATGDTYTLTCPNGETTPEIEWRQNAAQHREKMQQALEGKCGPSFPLFGNSTNTFVPFAGNFAETAVPQMVCTRVTGSGTCEVATEQEGKAPVTHALLTGSTAGLVVSEAGVLYVLRDPLNGPTVVQEFDQPGEPTAPTAADASLGGSAGFAAVQGLGLDPATGTLYISATTSIVGLSSAGHRVYYLNEVVAPTATVNEVTGITSTEATVHGTIDPSESTPQYPNPPGTSFRPEFKLSTDATWTPFGGFKAVTSPGPPTAVTTGLSELIPKHMYEVRYVAKKQYAATEFPGAPKEFTTLGDRPRIDGVWATEVRETSAVLHARINELETPSTYCFEFGTTETYGSSEPNCEPGGEVPAGEEVEVKLTGLTAGATYHFRVVVTSAFGTTESADQTFDFSPPTGCPNDAVRQQTGAAYLPDCRGYELVSPPQLGGAALLPVGPASPYTTKAGRFGYTGLLNAIPGSGEPLNGSFTGDFYVASRTTSGWKTKYVGIPGYESISQAGAPDQSFEIASNESLENGNSASGILTDTEMNHFVVWDTKGAGGLLAGSELAGSSAPYVYDNEGNFWGRLPTNLEELPGEEETPPRDVTQGGFYGSGRISGDFSHYIFSSRELAFAPGGETGPPYPGSLYDNDLETGSVTVISETEAGEPIETDPVGLGGSIEIILTPFVSEDGSRVLMTTRGGLEPGVTFCPCRHFKHLYLHDSTAGKTYEVSWDSLTNENIAVRYEGVADGGRKIFFSTATEMNGEDHDSSFDLYMWSEATNSVTLLSAGGGAGDSDLCTPEGAWTEKCNTEVVPWRETHKLGGTEQLQPIDSSIASETGEIYFYSPEILESGHGFPDARNLYVYRNGAPQFVAKLAPSQPITRINVSKDGKHMAFITSSRVTAYNNAGKSEMYTYDSETRTLTCASCLPDGSPPTFNVEGSEDGRFMTDDGRVFFATKESLVPRDANGINDVYEFVNARQQLISSGSGSQEGSEPERRTLIGVTANGVDAFFSTYDTLVGQDEGGGVYKFYDARTNGGFPFNKPPAPCEAADECHGPESQPAAPLEFGTGRDLGEGGNFSPAKKKKKHKHKHRRHHRRSRHHTRHNRGNG
ncbi:MAG TPA: NHL repeat-containing protein [Solirubrobacterales bacterium]